MPRRAPRVIADVTAILDSINEIFVACDRDWRVTYVNRRAARYLEDVGLEQSKLVGTVLWESVPFLIGTPFHSAAFRALDQGIEVEVEAQLPLFDRWFVTRVAPTPDGIVSYSRDVTARHIAEEAARSNAELIQALLAGAADAIFAKDVKGRYVMANRAAAETMGRSVDEVVGRTDDELFPAHVARRLRAHDERVRATGEPVSYEIIVPGPGGDRVFDTKKIVFRDAAGAVAGTLGIARDVTEHRGVAREVRRLNRDLEARIAELRALLDVIPIGIAVALDPEARAIRMNPAFGAMLGVEPGTNPSLTGPDAAAMRYRVLRDGHEVAPEDLPIQRAARGETILGEEIDVCRGDGTRSVLLCHAAPLFEPSGAPRGAVGAFIDITERRREEHAQRILSDAGSALNSTLDLDATLAAIAHMAIPGFADCCFVDLVQDDGALARVDLACAEIGRREQLLELARRYPPSASWEDHSISRAVRTGRPVLVPEVTAETRAKAARSEGHRDYLEAVGARSIISAPLVTRGEVLGALTFCLTASERRYDDADLALAGELAERAALAVINARLYRAARNELDRRARAEADLARWAHIFSHAGWGVAIIAQDGDAYEAVNPAFARMHGYEPADLVSRSIGQTTAPACRELIARNVAIARERGRVVFETRHVTRSGIEFPVLVDLTAVRSEDGTVMSFATNVQDLTERERAEAQVRQAQKMEALGRLAGGVAHDFNNVLMVIIGFADFLCSAMDPSDIRRTDAEEIRKAAERAAALTQQLLAFGRPRLSEPHAVNLNSVVRDMELMLRSVVGEEIRLETALDPGFVGVAVDRGQLEQVVMNLALNARDAMPEGGTLEIRTAGVEFGPGEAYGATGIDIAAGRYVTLVVADSGHGMDAATRARIFEPFFTTRRSSQNSGLGLAVVYGIVAQSRAHVWVESEPGRGTVFTLCFPRVAPAPAEPEATEASGSAGGNETILVVEDEDTVRTLTARVLTDAGYTVIAARDGREALDLIRRASVIDLVVTDVVMPVLGGGDLAERVAIERSGLPLLFMSGYTGAELVQRGLEGEEDRFLQKPFAPESLLRKVRALLDLHAPDASAARSGNGQRSHNVQAGLSIMSPSDHTPEPEER